MYQLEENFIRYAKRNTRSDANSSTIPTTPGQVALAHEIAEDLKKLGLVEVVYNEKNGFLTATLPANTQHPVRPIGFIAHLDTADYPAEQVQPQVHRNYDGQDVRLHPEHENWLRVAEFPQLREYQGQTLITTDGTTLLGADDKAGIVEIIGALAFFLENPTTEHGEIRVAFGPDEEIGRGADRFDAEGFRAAFAYTIDSGRVGHFEYETFHAAQARITFEGTSVHPGTAKGKLVNALTLAQRYAALLPSDEVPEKTSGYEGFYLQHRLNGTIDAAEAIFIVRDHDRTLFEERKATLRRLAAELNATTDRERVRIEIEDQYYNMREIIEKDFYPVDLALEAMRQLAIEPIVTPFRGGTDGSKISFKGIPTPNLFTGGENFHGQYEFITVEAMEKARDTIVQVAKLHAEKEK